MAFRADDSIINGNKATKNYLIPRDLTEKERERSEEKLDEIIDLYGPAIDTYPTWHPLVSSHDDRNPCIWPSQECGYYGLDHTRGFVNAFITCPYNDGQKIFESVDALNSKIDTRIAFINVEKLDVKFYSSDANAILVSCEWTKNLAFGKMIPASLAIPLLLMKETPCVTWTKYGETWETMRPNFLGCPHGSRSSLFVEQNTAITMKKLWEILINTGMFGPIKVSNQRT